MTTELIDEVMIANKALIKVAQSTIDSLDNAQSKSARTMKILMPQAKRYVFRSHPWNCLRKRTILVATADKPAFGFDYSYVLPADCLRPLAIQDDCGTFIPFYEASYGGTLENDKQYVVEGKYILTNTPPQVINKNQKGLKFVYTQNPENLNILDPDLVELLAYYLAVESSYDFTGSVNLKAQLIAEQKACLQRARAVNAQEVAPGIPVGQVIGAHW